MFLIFNPPIQISFAAMGIMSIILCLVLYARRRRLAGELLCGFVYPAPIYHQGFFGRLPNSAAMAISEGLLKPNSPNEHKTGKPTP